MRRLLNIIFTLSYIFTPRTSHSKENIFVLRHTILRCAFELENLLNQGNLIQVGYPDILMNKIALLNDQVIYESSSPESITDFDRLRSDIYVVTHLTLNPSDTDVCIKIVIHVNVSPHNEKEGFQYSEEINTVGKFVRGNWTRFLEGETVSIEPTFEGKVTFVEYFLRNAVEDAQKAARLETSFPETKITDKGFTFFLYGNNQAMKFFTQGTLELKVALKWLDQTKFPPRSTGGKHGKI